MPTYQTTPYIPWTFPDQAIAMNRKGVRPLVKVPDPKDEDVLLGEPKYGWAEAARQQALARLETNRTKDKGMRGLINTTERSQAYDRPAHLSQTRINGKFMDPSYEYTQTAGGLRGGTGLLTKEGRAWAKRRLQQRIQELDAIESQDYSRGPPTRITILPQTASADQLLAQLYNLISSAVVNSSLPEVANKLIIAILNSAVSIDGRKLSQYQADLGHIELLLRANLTNIDDLSSIDELSYSTAEEEKLILEATLKEIDRAQSVVEEIANIQKQDIPDVLKERAYRTMADEVLRRGVPTIRNISGPRVIEEEW